MGLGITVLIVLLIMVTMLDTREVLDRDLRQKCFTWENALVHPHSVSVPGPTHHAHPSGPAKCAH